MERIGHGDTLPDKPRSDESLPSLAISNNDHETEEFEFNDFTWETETKDFIDTLRKAGIETMIITNASTALLENLHAYAAEGCTIEGLCTVKKKTIWGTEEETPGIKLRIN